MSISRKDPEKNFYATATASGKSIATVGDITNSSINLQTTQNVDIKDFQDLLARFRRDLREADLDPAVFQDLDSEAQGVQEQAEREKPSAPMILGKLKTITDVVSAATGAADKLAPTAQKLGEMAGSLF